jgi:CrcB protein
VRRDPRQLLAVLAGGACGTLIRALLGDAITHDAGAWPWATLIVNVAGAFALGALVAVIAVRRVTSPYPRLLLGTGLCGGLTTFSTVQVELLQMLDRDRLGLALAYAAVSVVAGLAGIALARALVSRRGAPA